tara:strand:+ start:1317 stop:2978 length:1662 start_codon:yes stop_codon:yes gene_type:complete
VAPSFRVVLITGHDDERDLRNLVRRIAAVSGVRLVGVLQGSARRALNPRVRRYLQRHGAAAVAFNLLYHAMVVATRLATAPLVAAYTLTHAPRPQPAFGGLLGELNAAHVRVRDFHDAATIAALKALDADVGVVYGTPLVRPELFTVPRLGCINLHLAALPRYRGAGPVGLSEVIAGDREVGITIHRVDEGLDTGHVLGATAVTIEPLDTLRSLRVKATMAAHRVCADVIAGLRDGISREERASTSERSPLRLSLDRLTLFRQTREFRRRQPSQRRQRWAGLRTAAAALFLCLGWVQVRTVVRRWRRRPPVLVLNYHLITDRHHYLGLSTDEFIDHLEHLTCYYRIVPLADAVEAVRTSAHVEPLLAVTFDDGYVENAGWGRELCALYEVPVTVFVCADLVEGRISLSPVRARGTESTPSLNLVELRALSEEGYEIGGHTSSHADCGDPASWPEIPASRARLEAALQRRVRFFSFPYGEPENCPAAARAVVRAPATWLRLQPLAGPTFSVTICSPSSASPLRVLAAACDWRLQSKAGVPGDWRPPSGGVDDLE